MSDWKHQQIGVGVERCPDDTWSAAANEPTQGARMKLHHVHSQDYTLHLLETKRRSIGLTIWRRGALSLTWNGYPAIQLVRGDWWQATV